MSQQRSSRSNNRPSSKLRVVPTDLYYPPPHDTRFIRNTLLFYNNSPTSCIFKIKASEPKSYVVKPYTATVAPNSAARIQVTHRPLIGADPSVPHSQDRFRLSAKVIPAHIVAADDLKQLWETCGPDVELETDIACHFGTEVPAGIELVFGPVDASAAPAEAAAVAPSSSGKVSFTDDPQRKRSASESRVGSSAEAKPIVAPGAAAAAAAAEAAKPPAAATGLDAANGVERALANAQRMKDAMQTEVNALKQTAEALAKEVEAARLKSDEFETKGLRLHQLATQSKSLEESNAARAEALTAAKQRVSASDPLTFDDADDADDAAAAGKPAVATAAAAAGDAGKSKTFAVQKVGPDGASSSFAAAGGRASETQGTAGMYLSTVLLMMLLAYGVGVTVRVSRMKNANLLDLLPADLQDVVQSWAQVLHEVVNLYVQK